MNNGYYVPKKAMVIVAHPDDIEFSCAGTIARMAWDNIVIRWPEKYSF